MKKHLALLVSIFATIINIVCAIFSHNNHVAITCAFFAAVFIAITIGIIYE